MKKLRYLLIGLASSLLAAGTAGAQVVVLDFEGIPNLSPVGDFYAAQGFSFSPATLAIVDADAGGTGNFANEPSASTVMFFLDANNAILNVAAGFDTGFSFFYSSSTAATVNIYDGLNATGNLLGSLNLVAQFSDGCTGDPTGDFCNWTAVGTSFDGIARSIDFGGTANFTGYDNITFRSDIPGGVVPEPASWAMMIAGVGAVGAMARRRRRTSRIPKPA